MKKKCKHLVLFLGIFISLSFWHMPVGEPCFFENDDHFKFDYNLQYVFRSEDASNEQVIYCTMIWNQIYKLSVFDKGVLKSEHVYIKNQNTPIYEGLSEFKDSIATDLIQMYSVKYNDSTFVVIPSKNDYRTGRVMHNGTSLNLNIQDKELKIDYRFKLIDFRKVKDLLLKEKGPTNCDILLYSFNTYYTSVDWYLFLIGSNILASVNRATSTKETYYQIVQREDTTFIKPIFYTSFKKDKNLAYTENDYPFLFHSYGDICVEIYLASKRDMEESQCYIIQKDTSLIFGDPFFKNFQLPLPFKNEEELFFINYSKIKHIHV